MCFGVSSSREDFPSAIRTWDTLFTCLCIKTVIDSHPALVIWVPISLSDSVVKTYFVSSMVASFLLRLMVGGGDAEVLGVGTFVVGGT